MAFKTSSSPKTLVILLVVSTVTVVGILRHRQNIKQNIKVLWQTLGKLAFLAKVWVSISCQHRQVKHVRPTSELLNWAFQILTRLIS